MRPNGLTQKIPIVHKMDTNTFSPEEIAALQDFANRNGKQWKRILFRSWRMSTAEGVLERLGQHPGVEQLIVQSRIRRNTTNRVITLPIIACYYGPFVPIAEVVAVPVGS